MSGRIPQSFIDDLLARVDIVDLIDRHVPLKKAGANYTARCPFHTEKTPSFSVNRNKQIFKCFGCGASGNAISFLMDFNHLDFVEAVEDLANFVGVEVEREASGTQIKSTTKTQSSNQYQLLEQIAAFYANVLKTSPESQKARQYLQARGVADNISQTFMIGYAPDDWRTVTHQFDQAMLIETGMAISKDGKTYDRFRGRIMFPIRDKRGRVIAFGGRVLDDSPPKYLNSPETPIFHKSKEVYGLYELLQSNPKPNRILVVEGYMDVIALACQGIGYAVATLGTATSQTHMDLLFRFTPELVFCFDGDSAGQKAAWRAISSVFPALKEGRQIRIMLLPKNHDPDSLVKEEGKSRFEARIDASKTLSAYFFEHFAADLKLSELEHRARLKEEAEAYLKQLPVGSFRELMFAELAKLTKIHISDHEAILAYNRQLRQQRHKTDKLSIPSFVMALLVQNPELVTVVAEKNIDWDGLEFEGLEKFKTILTFLIQNKPRNYGMLLEYCRGHADEAIIRKLGGYDLKAEEQNLEQVLLDALERLLTQAKTTMLDKLIAKSINQELSAAEKDLLRQLTTANRNK